ncbi:MAG: alpha/beta fold hydrolase [Chitinophagales bacterium]|nr:alpha/beta fold hydrolase [Chitinophagales bacterium]
MFFPSSWPGPPPSQFNGHLQTIIPGALRKVRGVHYTRERIFTPDQDFLDLDWLRAGHQRIVVLTHGLEGDTQRQYMLGMAKLFHQNGWDVLAWNCRSCSGEMNRAFRLYHHGDTEDITSVVEHIRSSGHYREIALIGFSMGGNINMKYLGVLGDNAPKELIAAVSFSSPCDIADGADRIDRWDNIIYKKRFLGALHQKIRAKHQLHPGKLEISRLKSIRRWREFDELFSVPICGFRNLADFYQQASVKNYVAGIRRPTLLVNAENDPFLPPSCYPVDIAREHDFFHLEMPKGGGHCGFRARGDREFSWSEKRALQFCGQYSRLS